MRYMSDIGYIAGHSGSKNIPLCTTIYDKSDIYRHKAQRGC